MKKMKTKRFLSLLLALAMSFSLAVPAFAAIEGSPDDGIMPLSLTLYENRTINEQSKSNYTTNRFTSTPGDGQYIKVWFRNTSKQTATVKLYRTDSTLPVLKVTVPAGGTIYDFYTAPNTMAISYYVNIDIQNNYPISGHLAVAQKDIKV